MTEQEAFRYETDVIGSLKFYDIYNKIIPAEGEYSYMDCDFRDHSKSIICNKDYKYPRYRNRMEKDLYEGLMEND